MGIWSTAASLDERLAAASEHPDRLAEGDPGGAARLWASAPPFSQHPQLFDARLRAAGVAPATLDRTVATDPTALVAHDSPSMSWVRPFLASYDAARRSTAQPHCATRHQVAEPLVRDARARLVEAVENLVPIRSPGDPDVRSLVPALCKLLPGGLELRLRRVCALELNAARLDGTLRSSTSAERWGEFYARLADPRTAPRFFAEYPVLARALYEFLEQWVESSVELCARFVSDRRLLEELCGGGPLGDPVEAVPTGDPHRRGRRVTILRFQSGAQVVYKPRPSGAERHLNDFLVWLNGRNDGPQLRVLDVVDRGDYGWSEFAAPHTCRSRHEVARFYRRAGALLAVLYVLRGHDVHEQNLLACGEHPVVVDAECLFDNPFVSPAMAQLSDPRRTTVLGPGLLPNPSPPVGDVRVRDHSGFGSSAVDDVVEVAAAVEGIGTDTERIVAKKMIASRGENRAQLDDCLVDPVEYRQDVLGGFRQTYRTLIDARSELLGRDGPLASFAHDEVRFLHRPTSEYGRVLDQSFHPDLLRDGLRRDRFFDRLWARLLIDEDAAPLVRSEIDQLRRGDIPTFAFRADGQQVFDADGRAVLGGLPVTGFSLVAARIRGLDEDDLDRQCRLVDATLAVVDAARPPTRRSVPPGASPPSTSALIDAAVAIGGDIWGQRLPSDAGWWWAVPVPTCGSSWALQPSALDLAGGLPGIALFFACLAEVTGDERSRRHAEDLCEELTRRWHQVLDRGDALMHPQGAFMGPLGVVYLFTQLSVLWGDASLRKELDAAMEWVRAAKRREARPDVYGGLAGEFAVLRAAHLTAPSAATRAALRETADSLLDAVTLADGSTPVTSFGATSGFGHGPAGVSWALAWGAALLDEPSYAQQAASLIASERRLLAGVNTGLEGTRANVHTDDVAGWCAGRSGVGLGRLHLPPASKDDMTEAEVASALSLTLAQGFGGDDYLCHGALGNTELLLAATSRRRSESADGVGRVLGPVLGGANRHGWRTGPANGTPSAGLLHGLAGIGYQLLRCAAPDLVPSVLVLDPPLVDGEVTEGVVSGAHHVE